MKCPRCEVELEFHRPLTHLCSQCDGLWVEPGGLRELLHQRWEELAASPLAATLVANHPEVDLKPWLLCPQCGKRMLRYQYGADSGVLLDRCHEHGIWLDDGELGRAWQHLQAE